jgi:hypothetical protein
VSDARLRQPKKGETPDDASFAGFADHFRTAQQSRAEFTRRASFKTVKFLGCAICLRAAAAVSVPALRPSDQIVPPRITAETFDFSGGVMLPPSIVVPLNEVCFSAPYSHEFGPELKTVKGDTTLL